MEQARGYVDDANVHIKRARRMYRMYIDKSVPHIKERWAAEGVLLFLFMLRVVISQAWYVECYALALFLLNMFLGFLTPRFDPSIEEEMQSEEQEAGVSGLPTHNDDEFRPFVRRVPEFNFWLYSFNATLAALFSTAFRTLDIPVFWPILVIYFIILFSLTMRRQIQHMIKYRYIPFDIGKKKYSN